MSHKIGGQELTSEEYSLLKDLQLQAKSDPLTANAISQLTDSSRDWNEYLTSEERLVRFLFARELNVQKSHIMWQNWVNWFIQHRPDLVTASEVSSEIATKKARWIGTDKKGNPCLVVQIKYHIPLTETIPLTTKFFQYIMEIGLQKAKAGGTCKITVIWDSKGFNRGQLNGAFIEFLKIATRLLMDYYPNTLAAVYITDPDFIVRLGYGILKPFLSQIITNKIHQIPLKDLVLYIDPAELLQEYGGQLQEQSFQGNEQQLVNDPKISQQQQQLDGSRLFDSQLRLQTDEFLSLANDSALFFDQHSEIYHAYIQQQNQQNEGINHNYNSNINHINNGGQNYSITNNNNNHNNKFYALTPIPESPIDTSNGTHPSCCVSCSIF